MDPAPETNIVLFGADRDDLASALRERGVLIGAVAPRRYRAVTHLDVSAADVETALDGFRALAR